jgi:hypothetical protein
MKMNLTALQWISYIVLIATIWTVSVGGTGSLAGQG